MILSKAGLYCATVVAAVGSVVLINAPKEHCLASFSTNIGSRSKNQRHNALLSAQKLDGSVIGPGETFSFNRRIGSFSKDAGYRKAPVSYNGQLINSFGGGVCQTSTTMYNAALLAGLEIKERNRHHFAPNYVAPGLDAAVAYYNIDLKVKNPYPFKLKIRSWIEKDQLRVGFYGTGQAYPTSVESEVRQIREPGKFVMGDQPSGRLRNTGKHGFFVQVYRTVNGKRSLVSTDNYPSMEAVVDRR